MGIFAKNSDEIPTISLKALRPLPFITGTDEPRQSTSRV
jgi:hypothetical protein